MHLEDGLTGPLDEEPARRSNCVMTLCRFLYRAMSRKRGHRHTKEKQDDQEDRTEIQMWSYYLSCVRIVISGILNISVDDLMEVFDQRS